MVRHTAAMLLGENDALRSGGVRSTGTASFSRADRTPLIVGLAAVVALGVTAWPIATLLSLAASGGH
jgi:hypothetical protein